MNYSRGCPLASTHTSTCIPALTRALCVCVTHNGVIKQEMGELGQLSTGPWQALTMGQSPSAWGLLYVTALVYGGGGTETSSHLVYQKTTHPRIQRLCTLLCSRLKAHSPCCLQLHLSGLPVLASCLTLCRTNPPIPESMVITVNRSCNFPPFGVAVKAPREFPSRWQQVNCRTAAFWQR